MSSELQRPFEINGVYNFETLAPTILGTKVERARCEAELTYGSATRSGYPVGSMYRTIYPLLPAGTPDIPESLRYYEFVTTTGTGIIICEQWVDRATIELFSKTDVEVRIKDLSSAEIQRLTELLKGGGFKASIFTKGTPITLKNKS